MIIEGKATRANSFVEATMQHFIVEQANTTELILVSSIALKQARLMNAQVKSARGNKTEIDVDGVSVICTPNQVYVKR